MKIDLPQKLSHSSVAMIKAIIILCCIFLCGCEENKDLAFTSISMSSGESIMLYLEKKITLVSLTPWGTLSAGADFRTHYTVFHGKKIPLQSGFVYIFEKDGSLRIVRIEEVDNFLPPNFCSDIRDGYAEYASQL